MNQERLINVLRAPHVSEKSAIVAESNGQYVFKVADDATKPEIKAAVELMFNVEVNNVRTSTVKGKTKRFGHRIGRRNGWKKAYVTLKSDQEINLLGGAE